MDKNEFKRLVDVTLQSTPTEIRMATRLDDDLQKMTTEVRKFDTVAADLMERFRQHRWAAHETRQALVDHLKSRMG